MSPSHWAHSGGLSFYALFTNKNDTPDLLIKASEWWIKTHALDHFEKAVKIRNMIAAANSADQIPL
ncbi:DUF6500 family protein [Octadecabacter antarcticus]|uniref:DUF6500 family protein n=1 Tax=Octadecabacter antarcticus TaxID=1217908 RepID=UPI0002EB38BC|nr:DUF6500 family protein [Octadecabacter antarcticus]